MSTTRRTFLSWSALSAASLLSERALAQNRQKKGRKKPRKADAKKGKMNPRMRARLEKQNATGPKFQPPDKPLELGAWKYGKNSYADDTVLMFRGNPTHTFYGTGPISEKLRVHWKHRMEDFHTELRGKKKVWAGTGWTGTAAKLGDYVFVGSVGRNFYAYEAATGKVAWRYRGSRMFKSSVCIYDNKVYIGNVDDRLRCFDASTGEVVWALNTGRDLDSSPCVVDGRLYIAGENGHARCVDPQTGKEIWKTFLGGIGRGTPGGSNGAETSPAIADGEFYAANYDGELYCLNTSDGSRKWKTMTHGDTDASPVVSGEFVYAAAEEDAPHLYCFAREDGREVWRYSGNKRGYWSTPAVVGDRVYVGGADTRLHCVNAKTGDSIWTFKTGSAIWSSPCVVDGKVIFGGIDNKMYMLDAASGQEIWSMRTSGRVLSSPCIVDGHIWIGTGTGWFYCFGP